MSTPVTYREIFQRRAQAHDDAFRLYPDACRMEVTRLLDLAQVQPGEVLLDVPSAGGFLSRYVTVPDVQLIAVDPSPELHALCATRVADARLAPMHALPLPDASVDVCICLAGLHHEPDPALVFAEIMRVLKPGKGRAVIAEVESGSAVAQFLNGFVHQFNSGGHQGSFADEAYTRMLQAQGLQVTHDASAHYHWPFDSREALGDCLQRMFGIDLATPAQIAQAVDEVLGIDTRPDGRCGMRWALRTWVVHRPSGDTA
jgi:ubiquinone/menaquinone biosynthesis C-methylase UbiE